MYKDCTNRDYTLNMLTVLQSDMTRVYLNFWNQLNLNMNHKSIIYQPFHPFFTLPQLTIPNHSDNLHRCTIYFHFPALTVNKSIRASPF